MKFDSQNSINPGSSVTLQNNKLRMNDTHFYLE